MPIGLLPDAYFEPIELQLQRGDRVLLFSDGFREAQDAQGQMLEEEGLAAMMARLAQHRGPDLLDQLFAALCARAPGKDMEDDVSAIFISEIVQQVPLKSIFTVVFRFFSSIVFLYIPRKSTTF